VLLRGAQLIIKAVPFPGGSHAPELREGLEYRRAVPLVLRETKNPSCREGAS